VDTPDLMDPTRSFGKQALTNVVGDTKKGLAQDAQEFVDLLRKALNGDWASVAGVGIHQIIDQLNGQFLSRYNLPKNPKNGEFNPESFKPFLKAFREKVTVLLQGWLFQQNGGDYALNENTGEHYPIFSNTPFNQFADFFIPDYVPMKDLLVSICNAAPINNYLGNKLDELAITYLLNSYGYWTGNPLKGTVTSSILNALKSGAKTGYDLATTDYDNYGSLPKLTKDDEKYSPIFNFLEPRLNHLARTALNSLFLGISQSTNELIIDQGLKLALENSLVVNGMKGAAFTLAGLGSVAGWGVGGMVGGFTGGLSGSFVGAGMGSATGAGIGYKLALTLGGDTLAPFGTMLGTVLGTPVGFTLGSLWGATIGSWTGSAVGVTAAWTGTFAVAPRVMTHMAKSLAKTTKQELNGQLELLVDYYVHNLLPLTEAEHALYYLNPLPTPEEKLIYRQDYARREQLLSQSFVGEIIKQFIDLNDSYIMSALSGINNSYRSFVNYCLSNKDATAQEILEKAGLTDNPLDKSQNESDRAWREFVLRTADPLSLTDADQVLKKNLTKFPSFKVREQYLEQLSLYMNSLSAENLKEFAADYSDRKKGIETEKEHIKTIHQKIQNAGKRMAELYNKATGKELSR